MVRRRVKHTRTGFVCKYGFVWRATLVGLRKFESGYRRSGALPVKADERCPATEVEEALAVPGKDADEADRDWAAFGLGKLRRSRP